MRGLAMSATVLACVSCGASVGNGPDDNPIDSAPPIPMDGSPDSTVLGAWGGPQKITIAADPVANEDDGTLSYSGLELVFAVVNVADANRKDLFYSARPDLQSAFGPASKLPFSATGTSEETPRFSADDLTLFFAKTNGANGLDIHRVTRPAAGSTNWGTPSIVAGVNSAGTDKWFMPCSNNRYLMIVGADLAEGTLGGGAPAIVAELSSANSETGTFLTQDCLTVYFASNRPDGVKTQLYQSTRAAVDQAWSTPSIVTDFALLGGNQQDPFLATDNRTFVFASDAGGTNDIYISTR